jgi:predicted component of type VI protein secretion system
METQHRDCIIAGFRKRLDDYLRQCERFWKGTHERTYEKKMAQLHEAKQRVVKIYALSGFDACYALLLALKHLRAILPLPKYPEHAAALEAIKADCQKQLGTYFSDLRLVIND